MSLDRSLKGAMAECYACSFLIKNGYEVFRNICQHGSVDIVAIKNNQIRKFDVKLSNFTTHETIANRQSAKTPQQINDGVEILYITNNGDGFFEDDVSALALEKVSAVKECNVCNKPFIINNFRQRSKIYCSGKCAALFHRDKNKIDTITG